MTIKPLRKPALATSREADTKALTFRLPVDAHRQLKVMAAQNERTVTSIVTEGLNVMFKRHGLPTI